MDFCLLVLITVGLGVHLYLSLVQIYNLNTLALNNDSLIVLGRSAGRIDDGHMPKSPWLGLHLERTEDQSAKKYNQHAMHLFFMLLYNGS